MPKKLFVLREDDRRFGHFSKNFLELAMRKRPMPNSKLKSK
jgi:hypothetical protein